MNLKNHPHLNVPTDYDHFPEPRTMKNRWLPGKGLSYDDTSFLALSHTHLPDENIALLSFRHPINMILSRRAFRIAICQFPKSRQTNFSY